jgi:exodeoxyribonuclease-1
MTAKSIYWYDFETFGSNPRRDRAAQFAGLRTDEELNIIGEPLVIYCKPANDFLPSPQACLITGITPQIALEKGVNEAEFIRQIHEQFSQPETCVAGYNSIRFDDELTRQLLYRNFYDPYEREWKRGNSRWDIIDMLRLCAAVRPEGIKWPLDEKGNVSFRLEKLTEANSISHADAHDALADVIATIEMAKLVKQGQPRLFDYIYKLRAKSQVSAQLDISNMKPLVHVSSMYPSSRGCLALVSPICQHPDDKNGVIVYDLQEDPASWIDASSDEIRERVFTRQDELKDSMRRIPLKTLHLNRCPVIAPMSILDDEKMASYGIDKEACYRHWKILLNTPRLPAILKKALGATGLAPETDPDFMIYSGGFFNEGDRKLMDVVRESSPEQIAMLNLPFRDKRLAEMLFRYRARNFPESLDVDEQQRWQNYRREQLSSGKTRLEFDAAMETMASLEHNESEVKVLESLAQYAEEICQD